MKVVKTLGVGAETRLRRTSAGLKATRVRDRNTASRGLGHKVEWGSHVNLQPASVGLLRSSPSCAGRSFGTLTQPLPVRHAQAQGDSFSLRRDEPFGKLFSIPLSYYPSAISR